MKLRHTNALAAILLLFGGLQAATAQMNYQGRLTDVNGDPVTSAQATVRFALHDQVSAGNKLWGDFEVNVDVIEGRFNAVLGPLDQSSRPIDQAFAGGARFLEITLFDDQNPPQPLPSLPRQQVMAAPEAFNAVTLGASDRKVSVSKVATLGTFNVGAVSGFHLGATPGNGSNNGRDGLLMETTAGTESAGIFLNGDTISLFTAGNRGLLNIYDEDDMDESGNIPSPKFSIDGSGGFNAKSSSEITGALDVSGAGDFGGDLDVGGTLTASLITGTLSTPSLNLPDNLSVGTTATTHKAVIQSTTDNTLRLVGPDSSGHGARLNFGDADYVYLDENADDSLRIQANEVGIGGNPEDGGAQLQVFGGADASLTGRGYVTIGSTSGENLVLDNNEIICRNNGATARLHLQLDGGTTQFGGRVGIGTNSPVAPLHVDDFVNRTVNSRYYTRNTNDGIWTSLVSVSIKAKNVLEAGGVHLVSDRRIKEVVGTADLPKDLQAIQELLVTDYQMKDRVAGGDRVQRGFIAQEVKEVLPGAVYRGTAIIPNIYEVANALNFDQDARSLRLQLSKAHGLVAGDRVRVIVDEDVNEYDVEEVLDDHRFVIAGISEKPERAFVFGKEVDDFLSVDYNRIFATGISAIQQLKNEKDLEVKALQDENAELKAELSKAKQRLAAREAKDKEQDKQIAALLDVLQERSKRGSLPKVSAVISK